MQRNDFASMWPVPSTALSSALPTSADSKNTIHVWTAPVEQEIFDGALTNQVRFVHVSGLCCCGARPLAMMVSVDRVLIKMARFDAR
jgi:hypothetical protein